MITRYDVPRLRANDPRTPLSEGLTSWHPVELAPIVAGLQVGRIVGPVPVLMPRSDGACLLYPGEVHALHGEPESCKGWIVLGAVSETLTTASVLYVDFEDSVASVVGRLLALGTEPEAILERFTYVRPCDPFVPDVLGALLDARRDALAVIDGLSEAYGLLGLDPYSNSDAATFLATLPRPIAERGAAVLEVDHVIKSKDTRGRYAIGAQHKLAGIAAAYSTEVIRQPSRTDAGLVKLKIEKDRHGHIRSSAEGNVIALVHIVPREGGELVHVGFEPPDASSTDDGDFRPTALMGKVARHVEAEPGATSNAIRRGVPGKSGYVDVALRRLIHEGHVERRRDGQSQRHYSVAPFDEYADYDPATQPRSHRDPVTVTRTATRDPSLQGRVAVGGGANGQGDLQERVRAIAALPTEQEQDAAWAELEGEVVTP